MPAARVATLLTLGVLTALLFPAVPAYAGGPTSVLLAAPGASATALYRTDREYGELRTLVGVALSDAAARSSGSDGGSAAAHRTGPYVTVTWLIHDVQVWRVDRIYYEAPGGPWIYTETDQLNRAAAGQWRTSDRPRRLTGLLAELGLTGSDQVGPAPPPPPDRDVAGLGATGEGTTGEDATDGGVVPAQPDAVTEPATRPAVSPWWWSAGGLFAGLLLSAGGAAVWSSRGSRHRSPGPQLVDL